MCIYKEHIYIYIHPYIRYEISSLKVADRGAICGFWGYLVKAAKMMQRP